jgi:hypothetical protein
MKRAEGNFRRSTKAAHSFRNDAGSRAFRGSTHRQGEYAMAESQAHDDSHKDERVLVERLIHRQGVPRDEAVRLVDDYRQGRRAEIDPILMEGLEEL